MIRVQEDRIDIAAELAAFHAQEADIGAIVTFTGLVRKEHGDDEVSTMTLEHYPGMTEKSLTEIEQTANERWPLSSSLIIHRYGAMEPGEEIVLIATASAHRKAAFEAAEFLIDFLKTKAPFWKCEDTASGKKWVEAKESDDDAAVKWEAP